MKCGPLEKKARNPNPGRGVGGTTPPPIIFPEGGDPPCLMGVAGGTPGLTQAWELVLRRGPGENEDAGCEGGGDLRSAGGRAGSAQ
jgi:hypothetical protein